MAARSVVNPDARSPYRDRPTEGKDGRTQQYGKTPYRYSPAYYAWRRQHVSKQAEAERRDRPTRSNSARAQRGKETR